MKRRYAGLAIVSLAMLGCESNQPAEAPYTWSQDRASAREAAFARVNRQVPGHVLGCDSPYYRPWVAYMPQPAEWVPPAEDQMMDPEAAARAETASEPMMAEETVAYEQPVMDEEPIEGGGDSMMYDEASAAEDGPWATEGDRVGNGMSTRSKIFGRKPFVPRHGVSAGESARWEDESGEMSEPVEVEYDQVPAAEDDQGAMMTPAPAAAPVAAAPAAAPAATPVADAPAAPAEKTMVSQPVAMTEASGVSYASAAPQQTSSLTADDSAMTAVEASTAPAPAAEPAPAEYDNAFVINEAQEPQAFPAAGPEGEIVEKQYPAFRAAQVWAADVKDASQNEMFKVLYGHIKTNEIKMTSPVIIFYSEYTKGDPIADRLAFVYADPNIDPSAVGDKVEVIDIGGHTVLSIGVRGSYSSKRFKSELAKLHDFVEANPGYEVAGDPRYMTYNSPFVPFFLKYGEVQLPVKAK